MSKRKQKPETLTPKEVDDIVTAVNNQPVQSLNTGANAIRDEAVHLSKYLNNRHSEYTAMQLALIRASFPKKAKHSVHEWVQLIKEELTREYKKQ